MASVYHLEDGVWWLFCRHEQITLRLPNDLHARLKELAEREHRSLHAQVLHFVEQAVPASPGQPERDAQSSPA